MVFGVTVAQPARDAMQPIKMNACGSFMSRV
jgi:hypothetical protein